MHHIMERLDELAEEIHQGHGKAAGSRLSSCSVGSTKRAHISLAAAARATHAVDRSFMCQILLGGEKNDKNFAGLLKESSKLSEESSKMTEPSGAVGDLDEWPEDSTAEASSSAPAAPPRPEEKSRSRSRSRYPTRTPCPAR